MTRLAPLALALACAAPPREPPPRIEPEQLARLDVAAVRLERLHLAATRLDAADVQIATATTRAERRRAFAAYLAARQDLQRSVR